MEFSKLDDRPFRLFVQRTWERVQKDSPLSPTEDKLLRLVREHPDIDLFDRKKSPEIDRRYGADEDNPFLILAALWEVQKQLENDTPRGIVSLMRSSFPEEKRQPRIRQILGKLYLTLYVSNKDEGLSDKHYLYELARLIKDLQYAELFAEEDKTDPERFDYFTCNVFDQTISSLKAEIYQEASNRFIQLDMRLESALEKCPGEWISAMSSFWQRADAGLKRDRIKHLCEFLLDEKSTATVISTLDAGEREIINYLIDQNGHSRYTQLVQLFGDESNDEYWWTTQLPTSTIGRLRYKGLIFVGRIKTKYKAALIPTDLGALLAKEFRR